MRYYFIIAVLIIVNIGLTYRALSIYEHHATEQARV